MASLMVGRFLSNCCGRQVGSVSVLPRCWQQSYAVCAPPARTSCEPSDKKHVVPVFKQAAQFSERIAIRDLHGDYTYGGVFLSSRQFASEIRDSLDGKHQERVAFLCPNDATYVITQWACWMSGQIVVPLSALHPPSVIEYYVTDSNAKLLVTTSEYAPIMSEVAQKTGRKLLILDEALRMLAMRQTVRPLSILTGDEKDIEVTRDERDFVGGLEPEFYNSCDAIILYTSGTTGSPKGVVLSHCNLEAQVHALVQAWEWTQKDIILHTLPLYHMHGIINALLCPLYVGARCVMVPKFEPSRVWSHLLAINVIASERTNLFMAVPTMYRMLIDEYERIFSQNDRMREYIRAVCSQKIRLMVSGSAPLPEPIFHRWEEITGHRILERYGMSETGMVLSNPLIGERKPGFVGSPLPNVEVQIVRKDLEGKEDVVVQGSTEGTKVFDMTGGPGELRVRGPGVFRGYWQRPKATQDEITPDGWFKTGDTSQYVGNAYRILGRTSVDIIKTGGYKVSAIEVETFLLGHPDIIDVAVVGLNDVTWGQKVAAVVVPRGQKEIILSKLREWAKQRMAPYAIPTVLKVVEKLPKNSMGKVNKKELIKIIFPETEHV